MTKEEAIEVLDDLWKYEHSGFSEKDIREALEMAIRALKNEQTDGDLISREIEKADFLMEKVKDFESVAIRVKHNKEHLDRLIDYIHGVIKNVENGTFTVEKPIKHFGSIECPNCGRLLMLEEQTMEEVKQTAFDILDQKLTEEYDKAEGMEKRTLKMVFEFMSEAICEAEQHTEEPLRIKVENPEIKVDLISCEDIVRKAKEEAEGMKEPFRSNFVILVEWLVEKLPTYSQTFKPIAEIKIDSDEVAKKVLEEIKNREWIIKNDSAEQTYDWCKGCKEYDTEKHCCHRYSSFIRESLQDNINAVLEDIKTDIEKEIISGDSIDYLNGLNMALMIINEKHINGKEKK